MIDAPSPVDGRMEERDERTGGTERSAADTDPLPQDGAPDHTP